MSMMEMTRSRDWLDRILAVAILLFAGCVATSHAVEIDKPLTIAAFSDSKKTAAATSDSAKPDVTKPNAKEDANPAKPVAPPAVGTSEERAATALGFVRLHHPELVDLLERLKASNKVEYERAIRDLARTSDRLVILRERHPERYAIELESWKLKSQIQLLSARASLAPNEDLTAELRELIERQLELRAAQLELERSELTERLDRVEVALEAAVSNRQAQLDKQLSEVLHGIEAAREREADRRAKKTSAGKAKRDSKQAKAEGSAKANSAAKPQPKTDSPRSPNK